MYLRRFIAAVYVVVLAASVAWAGEPVRSEGISMRLRPSNVARMMAGGWGLSVDLSPHLKPESAQPVLKSADEVLAFVRKQDASVQQNGIWIVVSHPDSYSEGELQLVEDVKALCRAEKIPLFITRAANLPDGWRRYDQ